MVRKGIDYDQVLTEIGEFGPRQRWLFALMWLPSAASAMAVFMYEFIAFTPRYRCLVPNCEALDQHEYGSPFVNFSIPHDTTSDDWSTCQRYQAIRNDNISCYDSNFDHQIAEGCQDGFVYDSSIISSSATMDLGMVCTDDWKKSLAQSIYMLGMLIGSFLFGYLSDSMGRRSTLLITTVVLVAGGVVSAFTPADPVYFPVFAVCRFISGLGHVGVFMMSFTLSLEYTGSKWRVFCGCLIETPFALGGLIVGFLAWGGIRDWRTLQLVCTAPWILMLSFYWLVPESPRWLLAKGRLVPLEKEIETTAKWNKRNFPTYIFTQMTHNDFTASNSEKEDEASLLDLFRPWPICFRTLNMFYNWLVTTLCYYGLTMTASTLSTNIFLNYTLVILVEIPAHFFCIYVMNVWGRKPILCFCQILSGVACIAAGFLGSVPWLQVTLSLIGKFGATACFTIVFVYTAEMFPTEIRSTAVGSSSTCARIGGILAPQVAYLGSLWTPLPFIVMGGSAFIGGVIALINLPETLGKRLPETMAEALALNKPQNDNMMINIQTGQKACFRSSFSFSQALSILRAGEVLKN